MRKPVSADAPSVWSRQDFPDEDTWSFTLSSADQQALVTYAENGNAVQLAQHFSPARQHWNDVLTHGPGFIRLRQFPIDQLTDIQLEDAYLGLGRLFGHPVGQDREANLITHIRDERLPPAPGVRKYRTNLRQDFHSDGSDLVGLLCMHPARTGGESKIVSAHAVYNEMLRRAPHLVDLMYQPMPWDRNDEQSIGQPPYFELAPITDVDGVPRIFFIAWYIRDSQRHPEAPRLTDEQRDAIALVESIANDPAFHIEMNFRQGDVQLLNNSTVLHSREEYTDHDELDRRRHLLRLWLTGDTQSAHELLRSGIPKQGLGR